MSKIIDGKKLALGLGERLKEKIAKLPVKPKVISILVGDDPASVLYSNIKKQKAMELGIEFELKKYAIDSAVGNLISEIKSLNSDPEVMGVMIQLPLPEEFLKGRSEDEVVQTIIPGKDVDGLTGKGPLPHATVRAIFTILDSENIEVKSRKVAVVGATGMVGTPLVHDLKEKGAMVIEINRKTRDFGLLTQEADILISAVGEPNLVKAEDVKEGVVVIDVGMDVDFKEVLKKASLITPPKGGVGPVTVISLMENAVELADSRF